MIFTLHREARNGSGEGPAGNPSWKAASAVCCLLGIVSLASAQSLVEAARLEKARRARFIGKAPVTITNRDLPRAAGRVPVLEVPSAPDPSADSLVEAPDEPEAPPAVEAGQRPGVGGGSSGPVYALRQDDLSADAAEERLRERLWQQAKDRADNLEIAIGEYAEEYYASRDPASRRRLEQKIGETSERLDRAREEEAQAWVQMERRRDGSD